jgi:hypothetical protein
MPADPLRLSKSRYLSGLQCHKQLWWRVHEPNAKELSPGKAQQNLFAQGRAVGERAREYVPGGALIDLPFYQYDNKVAATRAALERQPPAVYEAWFLADNTYVGVDILERLARGYGVIEVKASNSRKPEHLPDAAVQVHVLRRSGLQVERAEVMHLNSACRYPDLSNLFVREDVTTLVEGALIGVPDELAAQARMLGGPLPDVPIGDHCSKPHECPFIERCWPKLPDHHISSLYRVERQKLLEYQADGYDTLYDLPTDLELSAIHARQVKAVQTGRMVVESSLAPALVPFASPLAFLDFETVSLAIPRWPECRPWQLVPVQFSVHVEERGRGLVHHQWIADGPMILGPRWRKRWSRRAPGRAASSPTTRASSATASASCATRCRGSRSSSSASPSGSWTCCRRCGTTCTIPISVAGSASRRRCRPWSRASRTRT